MSEEERFEILRAFDLLPHVAGGSWATIWFRINKISKPSREEFRIKVLEYFKLLDPLFDSLPQTNEFKEMNDYIKRKKENVIEQIMAGKNKEIEKRYERYIDYG